MYQKRLNNLVLSHGAVWRHPTSLTLNYVGTLRLSDEGFLHNGGHGLVPRKGVSIWGEDRKRCFLDLCRQTS